MVDIQDGVESDKKKSALTDYKFFCFNGEPRIMYVSKDNAKEPRTDFLMWDLIIYRCKPMIRITLFCHLNRSVFIQW